jgi:hypothetical protein
MCLRAYIFAFAFAMSAFRPWGLLRPPLLAALISSIPCCLASVPLSCGGGVVVGGFWGRADERFGLPGVGGVFVCVVGGGLGGYLAVEAHRHPIVVLGGGGLRRGGYFAEVVGCICLFIDGVVVVEW